MPGKLPFLKWFTGDWLRAPDVRGLSPAARGIWFDMLNIMHESSRRGYLLVSAKSPSPEQLARMTGCSAEAFSQLLTEIESSGVSSRTEHGVIYCRRMVRDESKRQKCIATGKLGGNPTLKAFCETTLKGDVCTSEPLKAVLHEVKDSDSQNSKIREVFNHYRAYHARAHPNPTPAMKDWVKVRERLNDGYSVEDLKSAIDGCHKSAWHMGENDRQKRYDSMDLIFRDSSHVQQFIEVATSASDVVLSEKTLKGMRAANNVASRWKEQYENPR